MTNLFNNSDNLFNDTNIQQSNKSLDNAALLYIFSPKHLNKQKTNALTYDFKLPFINALDKYLQSDFSPLKLTNDPVAMTSVIPSSEPIIQNTDNFSRYYSFMLIVDGEKNFIHGVNNNLFENDPNNNLKMQLPNNYRIIYLGFFSEEPYNPVTSYKSTPTFNLNAELIITRKTIYKKVVRINQLKNDNRPSLISDQLNVIYNNNIYSNKDECFFPLSPEFMEFNDEGVTGLSYGDAINYNDVAIESLWQIPNNHIKNITSAISDSFYSVIAERDGDYLFETDQFKENTISFLKTNDNSKSIADIHDVGFKKDSFVLFNDIIKILDPDILIVKSKSHDQLNVVDVNLITPETVYGNVIESTITSYLLKWGLASVSFIYDSYSNYIEVQSIESIEKCSQEELKRRFNNFWQGFRLEILSMLKVNCGEFYLGIFSHISSDNIVNLVFYDYQGLSQSDCMKTFNPIGGITNNQIGTADHVINNVNNMAQLLENSASELL